MKYKSIKFFWGKYNKLGCLSSNHIAAIEKLKHIPYDIFIYLPFFA